MDADTAITRINEECLRQGLPPVVLSEPQRVQAFASLQQYAAASNRPLEVAIKDLVRFQVQSRELELLRRQS